MAFKPNYNQQRAERDRAKARKKQEKLQQREEEVAKRAAMREETAGGGAAEAGEVVVGEAEAGKDGTA